MKKKLKWAGIIIGLIIVAAVVFNSGGGDSELVSMVQNGKLQWCPNSTLKQMADGFMASPSWESGKLESGQEFVNIRGGITYLQKPVDAAVQFFVDRKAGTLAFQAFELNGIPQNRLIQRELIQKMCASAAK